MEGGIDLQITSAEFVDNYTISYFIGGRNNGGLFEYDLKEEKERRILHQTGLNIKDLQFDSIHNRFFCSAVNSDGLANIASICRDSGDMEIYTNGDTIDSCPNCVGGEKTK